MSNDSFDNDPFLLELLGKRISGARALAVGFYVNKEDKSRTEEYLDELTELASSCGIQVLFRNVFSLKKIDSSTYLSKGHLENLGNFIKEENVSVVLIDEEITASQQRNLEKYLGLTVIDRTELILEIFSSGAATSEARLQIELAKARYIFPRLKRMWGHLSRQSSSGGVGLKGEGEKQIELDRRMLRDRVFKLKMRLKESIKNRVTGQSLRRKNNMPSFAIVGYTNSGKSTLLNLLTQAGVYAENKLFATLDTKTKRVVLPNKTQILLTDTVGFIRKLPHTLIAAFRSTLETAFRDDVLIHTVDVSNPMAEEHVATTYALIKELGIVSPNIITVLNKIDICDDRRILNKLRISCPNPILFSALTGEGLSDLLAAMEKESARLSERMLLRFRFEDYGFFSELLEKGLVISHSYDEDNWLSVEALIPEEIKKKFLPYKKRCS
ncbi:MAG: GTPase HflX [Victivallaceae bacterium]